MFPPPPLTVPDVRDYRVRFFTGELRSQRYSGIAMDDPRRRQRVSFAEFLEPAPEEPSLSIPPRQPFLPDPRGLMGVPA